jgi:predicted Zn-dependent protease
MHLERRGPGLGFQGGSTTIPVFLARAGLLDAAEQAMKEMAKTAPWPGRFETIRGEIALTRRDLGAAIRELEDATKVLEYDGWRSYFLLASESLANVLVRDGNVHRSIEVLERASSQKFRAGVGRDAAAPYWLSNRLGLARLYRRVGRVEEAQAVEADLLRLLALGDADHPILIELRRLSDS